MKKEKKFTIDEIKEYSAKATCEAIKMFNSEFKEKAEKDGQKIDIMTILANSAQSLLVIKDYEDTLIKYLEGEK